MSDKTEVIRMLSGLFVAVVALMSLTAGAFYDASVAELLTNDPVEDAVITTIVYGSVIVSMLGSLGIAGTIMGGACEVAGVK